MALTKVTSGGISDIAAAVEGASDSNKFTDADHTKLNGVAASANNYVHPNHSGDVTSTADGATVIGASKVITSMILDDNVTAAKLANSINTDIATGVTGNTTANAALPKAGGNLTGNLGIGETSPATSIHITSDTPKIRLEHTNDNGYAEIYTSAQSAIVLDADPGNTDNGTPIVFKTDGTERMRVLDSGGLTFNGDTASANALDDYEVGTWTPQQSNGTAFTQNGVSRYIKIGRLVHIQADINQIPSGSQIFGLPYTLNSNYHSAITIGYSSYGSGVMGYMPGGYAQIHLHILNGSAISSNNHRFIISGSYYANT